MRKFQFMVITLSLYLAGKTQACMKRSAFILSSVSFDPAFLLVACLVWRSVPKYVLRGKAWLASSYSVHEGRLFLPGSKRACAGEWFLLVLFCFGKPEVASIEVSWEVRFSPRLTVCARSPGSPE